MAYIYQIINDINDKVYIGKTEFSIERRFKQHCFDAFKKCNEKRPLYAAMRKYGIEHFRIELIEETEKPEEREIFWIEQKRSFKEGYNATMGGDGKKYIDYDLVIATYLTTKNFCETAKILNISMDSVRNIVYNHNIKCLWDKKQFAQQNQEKYGKKCAMLNKEEKIMKVFPSLREAARYIISEQISKDKEKGISAHISSVCSGKRKSAYGYIWKWI